MSFKTRLTEDKIQIACVDWLRQWQEILGDDPLEGGFMFWSTPNENATGAAMGNKLNKMGRMSGIADLVIVYFRYNVTHYLWIELKTRRGKLSANQERFLDRMRELPNCHGIEARSLSEFRFPFIPLA